MLTLSESFDDEGETKEGKEDAVQFLEAGEDAAVAFEPSEEPFDLVPFAIERPVIAPGIDPVGLRRNYGNHAQFEHQLPSLIAFGSRSSSRPSGTSCALPGERAKVMAVRASAATR